MSEPSNGNSHKLRNDIPERKRNDGIKEKTESFVSPIVEDVIIPAAQDTLIDIVHSIADGITASIIGFITGEPVERGRSYPTHRRRTDYSSYSRRDYSRNSSRSGRRSSSDISESTRLRDLKVGSRSDAIAVIEQLQDIMEAYGQVTCNDLYGLEEIDKTCPYTYTNWGWLDLSGAGIINNGDGSYSFDLPRPVQLNK